MNVFVESVNCRFNVRRGVAGASNHRGDIRCYKELALRDRILWDGAGCGGHHFIVWCVYLPSILRDRVRITYGAHSARFKREPSVFKVY